MALTLSLVFFLGCGRQDQSVGVQQVKTKVEAWEVVPSTMLDEVTLPGVVEPIETVTVSAEVSGKVKSVLVEEGAEVTEGQVLLQIEEKDLSLMVEQATSQVNEKEAAVNETKAGARPEELAQLKAAAELARATRDLAKLQAGRREDLLGSDSIAKESYEQAQATLVSAEKHLEQTEAAYKLAEKGAREETIQANEARLASARTALELAKRNLEKATIRSPIAGIIDEKFVEEGELIAPGAKLFKIVTADKVKVVVWAPERVMTKIRTGDSVRISFDAVKEAVAAPISRIAFAADEDTRTFKTEIILDNALVAPAKKSGDRKYRVGYIASAMFKVGEVPSAVKVPIESLVLQGPRLVVFTLKEEGGKFTAVANDVEVGLKEKNAVEIKRGVKAGDLVVVKGQRWLRGGEPVEVVETHRGNWQW
jgi:RND family efflux transporter MFP subunit